MHDALLHLAEIFKNSVLHEQHHTVPTDIPENDFKSSVLYLPITMPTESLSRSLPRVAPSHNPIASPPPLPPLVPTPDLRVSPQPVPRVDSPPTVPPLVPPTYHHLTTNPSKRRRERAKVRKIKQARATLDRVSFPLVTDNSPTVDEITDDISLIGNPFPQNFLPSSSTVLNATILPLSAPVLNRKVTFSTVTTSSTPTFTENSTFDPNTILQTKTIVPTVLPKPTKLLT